MKEIDIETESAIDTALQGDLEAISDALETASFRLPFVDRGERERQRSEMITGINRYLLPRVTDPGAPVVALLTGLTGTGKSTLLNSLAERRLSQVSAVRPTTSEPVIWAHRRHAGRYWQEFVAQVEEQIGPSVEVILGDTEMLDHLTLIDPPPLGPDSGTELLALADLSIFVTSATRYADSETWGLLDKVRNRGLPVLFVINRVPRDAASSQAVVEDYASKLAAAGFLSNADPGQLFVVFEHRIDVSTDGLPPGSVAGLRTELLELGDPSFRDRLTGTADASLFRSLGGQGREIAALARDEAAYGRELLAMAERAYNAQLAAIGSDLEHGRFASLVGESDPGALAETLARHIGIGAQETATAWSADPVGRPLIEGSGGELWHASTDAHLAAAAAVDRWVDSLGELAAERSRRRRMFGFVRRRVAATLREAALAGASAELDPKLLKRFGQQGAIAVVRASRSALLESMGQAFQEDASRFRARVGPIERLEVLAGLLDDRAEAFEQ